MNGQIIFSFGQLCRDLVAPRLFRYCIIVTSLWARWRLKSPASPLLTQPFIQLQIKENIKAPRQWPLCGEFTGHRWIPALMASNAENVSIWWRHHGLGYVCPPPTQWPRGLALSRDDTCRWPATLYVYNGQGMELDRLTGQHLAVERVTETCRPTYCDMVWKSM